MGYKVKLIGQLVINVIFIILVFIIFTASDDIRLGDMDNKRNANMWMLAGFALVATIIGVAINYYFLSVVINWAKLAPERDVTSIRPE